MIHTKHTTAPCGQAVEFLNVRNTGMLNKSTFTFYLLLRIVMNTYTLRRKRTFEVFSRFKFGWTQKKIGAFRTFARSRAVKAYETSFKASRLLLLRCIFLWHFLCSLRLMLLRVTIFCVQRRSRQLTTSMSLHNSPAVSQREYRMDSTWTNLVEWYWRVKIEVPEENLSVPWAGLGSSPGLLGDTSD
jgi:hypothetical protein